MSREQDLRPTRMTSLLQRRFRPRRCSRALRVVGLLASSSLFTGAFVSACDGEPSASRVDAGNAHLSTLAPIMHNRRAPPVCDVFEGRYCDGTPMRAPLREAGGVREMREEGRGSGR